MFCLKCHLVMSYSI